MIVLLREYDFEIKGIKGKENEVVYALSHHANLLFTSINYEYYLGNHILGVVNSDREYRSLKE